MKILNSIIYLIGLVLIIYAGIILGGKLATALTEKKIIWYGIIGFCSAASSLVFYYLTLKQWHSINHVITTKIATIVFGAITCLAIILGLITAVLMRRSGEYSGSDIINMFTPYFAIISFLIGPAILSFIFHRVAKNKSQINRSQ